MEYLFESQSLKTVFEILPYLMSGKKEVKEFMKFIEKNIGVCGKTWEGGDICFKCRTCETDPTCAICKDCFLNGNHEGHNYSMVIKKSIIKKVSNSSGMCDWYKIN
jgi:hypothetical protein